MRSCPKQHISSVVLGTQVRFTFAWRCNCFVWEDYQSCSEEMHELPLHHFRSNLVHSSLEVLLPVFWTYIQAVPELSECTHQLYTFSCTELTFGLFCGWCGTSRTCTFRRTVNACHFKLTFNGIYCMCESTN